MHVPGYAGGHVEIDHQPDADQVQASSQDPCAHHNVIVSLSSPFPKQQQNSLCRAYLEWVSVIQIALSFHNTFFNTTAGAFAGSKGLAIPR